MQNTHKKLGIHVVHRVAPSAHWGHKTPIKTSIYLWLTQWLMRLTGEPELIKWRDLHDTNVQLLLGLTEDIEWQVVYIVALRAQWGSRRSTMAQRTCHSCIIRIVAPVAHWRPRTLKCRDVNDIDMQWPRGLTGDTECLEMAIWDMVNLVAPMAHWGPRQPGNG